MVGVAGRIKDRLFEQNRVVRIRRYLDHAGERGRAAEIDGGGTELRDLLRDLVAGRAAAGVWASKTSGGQAARLHRNLRSRRQGIVDIVVRTQRTNFSSRLLAAGWTIVNRTPGTKCGSRLQFVDVAGRRRRAGGG